MGSVARPMAFRLCVGASRRAGQVWGNVAPAVTILRTGGQSVAGKGLGNGVTYHHSARMPLAVVLRCSLVGLSEWGWGVFRLRLVTSVDQLHLVRASGTGPVGRRGGPGRLERRSRRSMPSA